MLARVPQLPLRYSTSHPPPHPHPPPSRALPFLQPGKHAQSVQSWRPAGPPVTGQMRRHFIGGAPELEDMSYVGKLGSGYIVCPFFWFWFWLVLLFCVVLNCCFRILLPPLFVFFFVFPLSPNVVSIQLSASAAL